MGVKFITLDSNHRRTSKARTHRDYILLALRTLGKATTGPITNWINQHVKADRGQTSISKRGVQMILPKLEKEDLVSKNEYNEYSLTEAGGKQRIFGELYGEIIFEGLMGIPLNGTREEKMLECIKRFGLYVTHIFIQNLVRVRKWDKLMAENDIEWLNEAIDPSLMFEWFVNEFYPEKHTTKAGKFIELARLFEKEFREYFWKLTEAEIKFDQKVNTQLSKKL